MKSIKNLPLLGFFLIFITGCNPKDPTPSVYLQSADLVGTETSTNFKTQVASIAGNAASQIAIFIQYDYEKYKITYTTTDPFGQKVSASGALFLPVGMTEPAALAALHHGTIVNETDAPSYFNNQSESTLGAFLATTGIITAMPDYLGYGASASMEHPYESRKGLAQPNVDFLLAVKEFIKQKNINWNNNLMIAGYSEGGYANMATQKLLEEQYADEFELVASVCGAGAYDKSGSFDFLLKNGSTGNSTYNSSYIRVLLTYDDIYQLNRPLTDYFKEPYATAISKEGFRVKISENLVDIINDDFRNGLLNGTDTAFLNAIKDNDIYDWKPVTVTRLYHGTADTYVPYLNTNSAFEAMKKRGAENLSLYAIDGGDHGSSVSDFTFGTFELFLVSKNL